MKVRQDLGRLLISDLLSLGLGGLERAQARPAFVHSHHGVAPKAIIRPANEAFR
jgi:hypothetical protein